MAYVNAEMTKAIRNALKAKFPGVKFSVKKSHGSIDIVIQAVASVGHHYKEL